MTTMPQPDWFEDQLDHNCSPGEEADDGFMSIRQQARREMPTLTRPHKKQEAWRYTDFPRIFKKRFVSATYSTKADTRDWVFDSADSYRVVFVNQRLVADLSSLPNAIPGVTVGAISQLAGSQREVAGRYLEDAQTLSTDVFDTLNRALIEDGLFIHIAKDTRVERPIEVVYLNSSRNENALIQPRSVIILEAGARADLIERYCGSKDSDYFYNGMSRIELHANASLQHCRLQQEGPSAHHLSRVCVLQHRASRYDSMNISLGANWSRTDMQINLQDEEAECALDGLYVVSDSQYNDFHIDIQHRVPHCNSRVDYRGLIDGAGRAVFDGRILVLRDAQKTDARLSNRNLLLAEKAQVDTKPQLEIYADDVKCSHGATVGRIDPEQLYYCRTRGLSKKQASALLSVAFANQVIDGVEDPTLRNYLHRQIDKRLNQDGGDL